MGRPLPNIRRARSPLRAPGRRPPNSAHEQHLGAISFTIISVLAGCLNTYYIAFYYGGPVAITWGWLLVGVFCVLVALAMGEIASAMPTAGALYSGRASSAARPGAGSPAGST